MSRAKATSKMLELFPKGISRYGDDIDFFLGRGKGLRPYAGGLTTRPAGELVPTGTPVGPGMREVFPDRSSSLLSRLLPLALLGGSGMKMGGSESESAEALDPSLTDNVEYEGPFASRNRQVMSGISGLLSGLAYNPIRDNMKGGADSAPMADFTNAVEAGLMSPEEADMLGVDYANAGFPGEVDMVSEEISPRGFAKTFDPTSTEDVKTMQGMLGVEQDGVLGPITLKALRGLQGVPSDDIEYGVSEELPQFYESVGEPAPFDYKTSADIDEPLADFMLRHDGPERPVVPLDEDIDDFTFGTSDSGMGRLERESALPYLMQDPVYAEPAGEPVVNTSVFEKAMKNMMDDPGTLYSVDLSSPGGEAFQGVSPYDERFMQSPSQSRSKLAQLIQQALNVSGR